MVEQRVAPSEPAAGALRKADEASLWLIEPVNAAMIVDHAVDER